MIANGSNDERRRPAGAEAPPRRPSRAATGTGGYEQLSGAEGRQVFFRPERYGVDALGPVRPLVRLTLPDGETRECALHDVSQNGVAVRWDASLAPPPTGSVVERLSIAFDECVAYDGAARVSSLRRDDGGPILGAAFVDSLMDVDDVLLFRDLRAWAHRSAPRIGLEGKAWHVAGHETFKSRVCELRLFLEDAETEFRGLEDAFPSHLLYREVDSAARSGMLELIDTKFVAPFLAQAAQIDAALRAAEGAEWQALREFSLRQVHSLMTRSRSLSRALHKPLGYPGDYLVLESIYEKGFEGPTLFDRAVERAILSLPAAAAVRGRKDLLRGWLTERIGAPERHGASPLRIVSVASGPAREFAEVLGGMNDVPAPVEIVLFDQDKSALAHAYGQVRRSIDARIADRVRVTFLHDSIRRLLHDPEIFASFGPFDVIVCSGLFDYLSEHTATALAAKLYANLDEGGVAWIGNMRPDNPTRWAMEHHMDWDLVYRTTAELRAMGEAAVGGRPVRIEEERTGINPFVILERV